MSRELPYFKFYTVDWNNGDITLEDYAAQGVFINVCAYYWDKECNVTIDHLKRKFRQAKKQVDTLINSGIIKINDGKVIINFLVEQLEDREHLRSVKSENGKKGGRPPKNQPFTESENKPNAFNQLKQTISKPLPNKSNIEKEEEKEIKEEKREIKNKEFSPPLFSEVFDYFEDKKPDTFWDTSKSKTEAQAFIDYYGMTGWLTDKGPIVNWHNAANGWIRNDGKFEASKKTVKSGGKVHPDHYSKIWEASLNTKELTEYWTHLRSLGFKKKEDRLGNTVGWFKED